MKHIISFCVFVLLSLASMAQSGTDLFFSEYLEGTGNNQALEIFNPGADPVNLSGYCLVRSNDGGGWEFWWNFPVAFLSSKTAWTILNDQFTAPLFDISLADTMVMNSFIAFRGNDAIGLMKVSAVDTVLIDVIGIPDINPGSGWNVAGILTATANHTLIRKSSIVNGNTNWDASRDSSDTNSEWIVKDIDFVDSLSHHFFKPIILITSIKLSPTGSDTIKTDLGTMQINTEILPASATDTKLLWSSTQTFIASVNQNGLVQAFNDGKTDIIASSTDGSGISDTIRITTINQSGVLPVNSITVDGLDGQDTISLNKGTILMIPTIKPVNATNKVIVWSVDNTVVADITADGLLTAKKNGKVMVTATSTDGSGISGSKTIVLLGQYSEVISLSDLRAAYSADETVYKVTGEVVLSHWIFNRNIKYVQDAGAGIEIDDESGNITTVYKVGDGISGLTGYMEDNYGMIQFHPIKDPGAVTAENKTLTPIILTVKEFNDNFGQYESRLIKINQLEFDQAGTVFQEFMNYTIRVGSDITVLRTEFANADYLGTTIPDSANVTGIAIRLNTTPKIAPRKLNDIDILSFPITVLQPGNTSGVRIYPNPVAGDLFVTSLRDINYFEIKDISGRIVMTGNHLSQESFVNTRNLDKGIYVITFYLKNNKIDFKFIKE